MCPDFSLAGDILLAIRTVSAALETEWHSMRQRWQDFLNTVFPSTGNCYLLKFVPLIGTSLS